MSREGIPIFAPKNRSVTRITSPLILTILLCGDVSTNPGPVKYPCTACEKPVARTHRAVMCDQCENWVHIKCIGISTSEYKELVAGKSCAIVCNRCTLPTFTDSFYEDLQNHSDQNSFHSLDLSHDETTQSEHEPMRDNSSGPQTNLIKEKLKIMTINCRSLRSKEKQALLKAVIDDEKPNIICGQETHLDRNFQNSEVFPDDYNIERTDRTLGGGGVFVATKKDLVVSSVTELDTDCEIKWIKLEIKGLAPLYISSYYRTPDSEMNNLEGLRSSLEQLYQERHSTLPNVILAGDFNTPSINWANLSVKSKPQYGTKVNDELVNIVKDHSLHQRVTDKTRQNNTLDLIMTTYPGQMDNIRTIPGMSDHGAVVADINLRPQKVKKMPRKVFVYKKANNSKIDEELDRFTTHFMENNPHERSVKENWIIIKTKLLEIISINIPQRTIKGCPDVPWITHEIKRMIKTRKRLYSKTKGKSKPDLKKRYHQIDKLIKQKLSSEYNSYVNTLLDDTIHRNPKKFYQFINAKRSDGSGIPPLVCKDGSMASSDTGKAEALNTQYQSVFTKEDLINLPQINDVNIDRMPNITFSLNGIVKLMENLNINKSNGPDQIPIRILKDHRHKIAPLLQFIFQQSYNTGELPDDWLTANVVPIFKKGSKAQPANYRPVALTAVTCKMMEHIIHKAIAVHLTKHQLLSSYQHGFREKHSCESQLIITLDDLHRSLDNQNQTDMAILDFSKAFDCVAHQRLLMKLKNWGVRGHTHAWIDAWLTNRTQQVVVNGATSKPIPITSGVPQGSVLGPLMFIIFINDIGHDLKSDIRLFADDCLIYRTIETPEDTEILQKDLTTVCKWADKWQMRFNVSKCNILRVYRISKPIIYNYTMNNECLNSVQHHPYLGVELDQKLNFNHHIDNITCKATKTLNLLKRNLKHCSQQVKKQAFQTLVRPQLEYSSSVWDPYTSKNINKIEMVQRRAVRWVFNDYTRGETSITKLRRKLEWPPLDSRRYQSRLTIFWKIEHNHIAIPIPSYVESTVRVTRSGANYIRPRTTSTSYLNSYFPQTIADWNLLPPGVRSADTLASFKSQLANQLTN